MNKKEIRDSLYIVPGLRDREDVVETRVAGEERIFSDLARKRVLRSEREICFRKNFIDQRKGM